MKTSGFFFTWSNNHEEGSRVYSKLDRVFTNESWLDHFPNTEASFRWGAFSDHSYCLVKHIKAGNRGTKPFRFCNHWVFKEDFRENVLTTWKKHMVTDLQSLHHQLFRVKHILKNCYVKKNEDIIGQYNDARDKFMEAQEALAINPKCPTTVITEKLSLKMVKDAFQRFSEATGLIGNKAKSTAHKVDYARNIWNRMVHPKHRFVGWQIVNNQLLTRDNLSRFLSISSPLCPVCCRENESHQHLLVHCCFTRNLICEITKWCGHFDWSVDFSRWFSKAANNMQERIINTVILATLYTVWTNRNICIFELSCKTASTLSKEIKSCVKSRCLMGSNGGKGKLDSYIFNMVNLVYGMTMDVLGKVRFTQKVEENITCERRRYTQTSSHFEATYPFSATSFASRGMLPPLVPCTCVNFTLWAQDSSSHDVHANLTVLVALSASLSGRMS
ncbi:hypothetical protein G4B88_005696 [Cannabis sativa]|uniref:Reverse transcriptase zinc-binding domain-containing protein n=1 Tax=Cannabis sativa TaxID=3483 RepID=A0A7J6DPD2_CANSA|nr:hypothetical protein G4B88_005696 [Cannabis sativa]